VGEDAVVSATSAPATSTTLRGDLERLGVADGMTVLVNSSLSRLGWVAGGAQAVVSAGAC
jgi:aminoglycoside 3-N-acetyltransferase